jgi:pyruvate/2-oxoglutarate dehydrogenase complex dihydrolipoamide acyltransferase (E2) component
MPEMGESVTEGIVLEWHVAEGDFVNEGDTVVEVSTDKVDAEVPAPTDGVITKLIASVDDEIPVGAPLAEMEPGEEGSGGDGGTPAAPGREAEEAAVDGEALPSADDDRNLTPSEEAEGPDAPAEAPAAEEPKAEEQS